MIEILIARYLVMESIWEEVEIKGEGLDLLKAKLFLRLYG